MRLVVARCEVSYIGRLTTVLPEAVRLLMLKADGTFMVWADGGGPNVKPLNWMTPPTVLEEQLDADGELTGLVVRKQRQEDRVEITVHEVIADIEHELDTLVSLEKEGLERELQELLADAPNWCGEGFRLVRREWPTDIGPVDLMCRDHEDEWIPGAWCLSRCTCGAADQAAGTRTCTSARHRVRRGRSRGSARRTRAGVAAVRGVAGLRGRLRCPHDQRYSCSEDASGG
jgi:hypothetical protein